MCRRRRVCGPNPRRDTQGCSVSRGKIVSIKKRVFEIIEKAQPGDRASRWFDLLLVVLILIIVIVIILASTKGIREAFGAGFAVFEVVSVVVFLREALHS